MTTIIKPSQGRLNEIDFMRPIVIILLIMMHTFTIYAGGWPCPEGIDSVPEYKWIQIVSYGCMLEAFTFISGYLFGFQLSVKEIAIWPMIISKLKRLIVPSLIFSILYVIFFQIEWGG